MPLGKRLAKITKFCLEPRTIGDFMKKATCYLPEFYKKKAPPLAGPLNNPKLKINPHSILHTYVHTAA
jgi:hypothetical protein